MASRTVALFPVETKKPSQKFGELGWLKGETALFSYSDWEKNCWLPEYPNSTDNKSRSAIFTNGDHRNE